MINSIFDNQLNILNTEFKGDITKDELLDYLIDFKENTYSQKNLKSIVDTTNASYKFSFKDLNEINTAKNESIKSYDTVLVAVIINNPVTAAISTLFAAIANTEHYKHKAFSTHEAALMWISSF